MCEVSFHRIRSYQKLGEHEDYVFNANQGPRKLKRSDGSCFFVVLKVLDLCFGLDYKACD